MFIRGYNHSLLKSPEQKPKWPKSFSNHPTSWKTTTLEAIHHIYIHTHINIYIYIFSLFNVLSLHSNEKHDFWDTMLYSRSWSVAWMCLSLLWIGSMVVPGTTRTKQLRIGRHFWTFNDVFDFTFERCGTVHKSRKAFKARPYCNVSNRSVGNDKKKQSGEKTCRELPTE